MKRKPKRKPRRISRLDGREPWAQLYRAIARYVKSKGGSILVIGGIEIQEWPSDPRHSFRVAVRCLGRKPSVVTFEEVLR